MANPATFDATRVANSFKSKDHFIQNLTHESTNSHPVTGYGVVSGNPGFCETMRLTTDQLKAVKDIFDKRTADEDAEREATERKADLGNFDIFYNAPAAAQATPKSNRGWKVMSVLTGIALAVSVIAALVLVAALVMSAPVSAPIVMGLGGLATLAITSTATGFAVSTAKA